MAAQIDGSRTDTTATCLDTSAPGLGDLTAPKLEDMRKLNVSRVLPRREVATRGAEPGLIVDVLPERPVIPGAGTSSSR